MSDPPARRWEFLTNHAQVLLCIARAPDARLRDIAERVGITERAAHRVVSDLIASGYLTRERVGRRNRYTLNEHAQLPDTIVRDQNVGDLLAILIGP